VGLGEVRYRALGTYSLGMEAGRQAGAGIAHGPKLLFLDEPTNGLDPPARVRMIQLIQEIRDRGDLHLLLSSHLLRDVEECCDEVLILKDARSPLLQPGRRAPRQPQFPGDRDARGTNGLFLEAVEKLGCETAPGAPGPRQADHARRPGGPPLYQVAAEQNVQNPPPQSQARFARRHLPQPWRQPMAVYKKTYRPYEGGLTSRWTRFLVIPRYGLRDLHRRASSPFLYRELHLPADLRAHHLRAAQRQRAGLVGMPGRQPADRDQREHSSCRCSVAEQCLALFLAAFIGPGQVSPDLANTRSRYLARPFRGSVPCWASSPFWLS